MTENATTQIWQTQTWPIAPKQTNKNNLAFSSEHPASCAGIFTPAEMQLVLVLGNEQQANDLIHTDLKLSIFLGSMESAIYCQSVETVVARHKNKNMYTVPFVVNSGASCASNFSVVHVDEGASTPVFAMITFSSSGGKPHDIVGAHLMVTGRCSKNNQ